MKKYNYMIIVVFALLLSLIGCSSKTDNDCREENKVTGG